MAFMHAVSSVIVTTSQLLVFPDVAILSFLWYSPKQNVEEFLLGVRNMKNSQILDPYTLALPIK